MSDEAVHRMHDSIAEVVRRPEVKTKLLEQGAVGTSSTPEALAAIVHKEIGEWRAVVKRAQIEGD
jgi:tripartite-type tricarboxylate transporter receptor subunit TctC